MNLMFLLTSYGLKPNKSNKMQQVPEENLYSTESIFILILIFEVLLKESYDIQCKIYFSL